jgi:acetyltransferase-like isoleucine patch superfamily enzyme
MQLFSRLYNTIFRRIWHILNKSRFSVLGKKSFIKHPLLIQGAKNIVIKDRVYIAYKAWLAASPDTNEPFCKLEIGEGTVLGNFNHIYATKSIILGKNVLTADKVYIGDNQHGYEDHRIAILHQPIKQIQTVQIGDGTWLGENVCVIGANIGKNCVIGANAVVTKDIPDYSVAVGAPAKVIKRYSFDSGKWEKTDKKGKFIKK